MVIVLPILLNLVVIMIPTLFSFYVAFTEWSGLAPEFVGLRNFRIASGWSLFQRWQ
jgi:ABC-type sugar transport system permease subunit